MPGNKLKLHIRNYDCLKQSTCLWHKAFSLNYIHKYQNFIFTCTEMNLYVRGCLYYVFFSISVKLLGFVYRHTYKNNCLLYLFLPPPFFCFLPNCSNYSWKSIKSQSKTVELLLFFYHIFPPDGALLPLRIVPLGLSQDVQTSCLCFLTDASTILQSLFMQNLKRRNRTTTTTTTNCSQPITFA